MPTTQPFTHTPRAPRVPTNQEHSNQRYFCDETGQNRDVYNISTGDTAMVRCKVMRFASDDLARIELCLTHDLHRAVIEAHLNAPKLREIAQRLLDAAHDIETNPAAVLMAATREAAEAVPA